MDNGKCHGLPSSLACTYRNGSTRFAAQGLFSSDSVMSVKDCLQLGWHVAVVDRSGDYERVTATERFMEKPYIVFDDTPPVVRPAMVTRIAGVDGKIVETEDRDVPA